MPVTVSDALKKGRNTVMFPSMYVFLIFLAGGGALSFLLQGYTGPIMAGGVILGLIASLLYWCLKVNKWKIWAYENVDHIHELQQKAIDSKIIYPDGTFWDRLAVASAEDKQRLAAVQDRFKQKDIYTDDIMVPAETSIYFSKLTSMGTMIVMAIVAGFGIYLVATNVTIPGIVMIAAGLWFSYNGFKEYTDKTPQIILSANGIQTENTAFQDWKVIKNERVYIQSSGKSSTRYFTYDYPGGTGNVNIDELDINRESLENLLHVYRVRSEKRH